MFCFPKSRINENGGNRPRLIDQYSNMAPRLSGQTSIFGIIFFVSKSLLGIEGQKKHEKFAILTRKPRTMLEFCYIERHLLAGHFIVFVKDFIMTSKTYIYVCQHCVTESVNSSKEPFWCWHDIQRKDLCERLLSESFSE